MRTTNFYRSQQGGSAPQMALLSGATAGLPFIREFFAEKLNIPIDYFNALRNVTVAGSVDQELVASNGHNLGDLVGSALNQIGVVPVQIDLIPESVTKERELDRRKPALVLSVLTVAALLAALGFFFTQGAKIAGDKVETIKGKKAKLSKLDDSISAMKSEISDIDGQQGPYVEAILRRVYWVQAFNYLGNKMQNDLLFMTVLEPTSGGIPVIDDISDGAVPVAAVSGEEERIIDAFSIEGLWRENSAGGSEVVYNYFKELKKDSVEGSASAFFDLKEVNISEVAKVDVGTAGTNYSYSWKMTLPLPDSNKVKFTK